ncbi:hypothetical protein AMECASPLE_033768 [Ameca splendens]|uniref:Uncharacterized protein n=1 Tax=Ameca splendens TaxID=208324 RepID=A0ABV0Z635_9TELE
MSMLPTLFSVHHLDNQQLNDSIWLNWSGRGSEKLIDFFFFFNHVLSDRVALSELQRRAHRPHWQPSMPKQIQPWTQRPQGHVTPQAEARQSPGVQAPGSIHRE